MYQKIAKFTWSKWHSVNETVPMPSATATPAAGPLQHSAIAHRSENSPARRRLQAVVLSPERARNELHRALIPRQDTHVHRRELRSVGGVRRAEAVGDIAEGGELAVRDQDPVRLRSPPISDLSLNTKP